MGIYMYLDVSLILFLFMHQAWKAKTYLLFLYRQSSKQMNSSQTQHTYFLEEKDALLFNVSAYVAGRRHARFLPRS